jgi:uncharacterized protein (TIGR03083 family)
LAQSDEGVAASADGAGRWADVTAAGTVDDWAARMVAAERTTPDLVLARWREARDTAVAALRAADQDRPLPWAAGALKPATLATTRLAEYWAHGLDITEPPGIDFPDTGRLRHIAWLAAGAFCRVAAQRLDPAASGLRATGPHGAAALRVLRTSALLLVEKSRPGPFGIKNLFPPNGPGRLPSAR